MATEQELYEQFLYEQFLDEQAAPEIPEETFVEPLPLAEVPAAPPPEGGTMLNTLAQGASFGSADEVAALGASLVGNALPESVGGFPKSSTIVDSFNDILKGIRSDTEAYREREPAAALATEALGGIVTGGLGAAKAFGTQAVKQVPKMLRVPAIAGAEGAAYGFNTGDTLDERSQEALKQGAIASVAGPVLAGGSKFLGNKLMTPTAKKIIDKINPKSSTNELKRAGKDFYKLADDSNVIINPTKYNEFAAKARKSIEESGFDTYNNRRIQPGLTKMERHLAHGEPVDYKEVHALKKTLSGISQNAKEGSHDELLANKMIGDIDELVWSLRPEDIVSGSVDDLHFNLSQADDLWSRYEKSKTLEKSWAKINRSDSAIKGNLDNAISTEVRSILNSAKKSKGFSKAELDEMDKMLTGSKGQNLARWFREFSPTSSSQRGSSGPIIALSNIAAGGGAGLAASGSPVGAGVGMAVGAIAPPIVGAVGRTSANRAAKGGFNDLLESIQRESPETIEEILNKIMGQSNDQIDALSVGASASPWFEDY